MTRRTFLAATASAFSHRFAQSAGDSRAVLSALIPILQPTARKYLIFDTTIAPEFPLFIEPDPPRTPLRRSWESDQTHTMPISVPLARQPQFREALADFALRKGESRPIPRNLDLPKPYLLLSETDRQAYLALEPPNVVVLGSPHPWHLNKALASKYKHCGPLCSLSEVYFDRASQLAMVWTQQYANCRWRTWHVFEKINATWRAVPWEIGGTGECA